MQHQQAKHMRLERTEQTDTVAAVADILGAGPDKTLADQCDDDGALVSDTLEFEDEKRAQLYRLLAHFLSLPPSAADLKTAAALNGDDNQLGRRIAGFAVLAGKVDMGATGDEYQNLFIGLGRGELVPYGSYYLTGFLHEKPLARLRRDMARLGVERDPDASEPEDHIASVLEMMAGFIDGSFGTPLSLSEQKKFYDTHIGCWAPHFFADLEAAKSSVLYAALGAVGLAFMQIEQSAFEMI